MGGENETKDADARKLNAERVKLELEAKEIERRLNARWWEGSHFPQYALATVVTAALLFGWAKTYLEPIVRRETELNKIENELLEARNRQLDAQDKELSAKTRDLATQRDRLIRERDTLATERDRLTREGDSLRSERRTLEGSIGQLKAERDQLKKQRGIIERQRETWKQVVFGVARGLEEVAQKGAGAKYFSILNRDDPINKLESHGWKVGSNDYFSKLGYYLEIRHDKVRSGQQILVGRKLELDALRKEMPDTWLQYIGKVTQQSPFLALDYSYFGLRVDEHQPVGGTLYRRGQEATEFHAPLSEWASELGTLLR